MAAPERLRAALNLPRIKDLKRTMFLALYPRHCPFCSKILASDKVICPACEKNAPYITDPVCYRCGKQVLSERQELCYDCKHFPKSFKRGLALFHYNDSTRPLIADLKYHNKRVRKDYIVRAIISRHKSQLHAWKLSCIVPVPIHPNKKALRGYNQAALIATALSEELGIPAINDMLLRTVDTLPQKTFSAKARYRNLSTAFALNPKYKGAKIRRILLIDDIYTSGATMEACTKVLRSAGFQEVYIYSICIGTARD